MKLILSRVPYWYFATLIKLITYPAGIYLLKVNNKNTRKRCDVCSKLTIKTLEQHQVSAVFSIVNFEHVIASRVEENIIMLEFVHPRIVLTGK